MRVRFALVTALVAALVLAGPMAPASAVKLSPNAPTPVNVLPSTVGHLGASTGVGAPASYQQMVYFLYQASETIRENPGLIDAGTVKHTGGALTPVQAATITTVQSKTRIPLGGIASVARGGAAMIAAEAGIMMGVGALDLFWTDRQGQVCRNVGTDPIGQLTALAARADCSGVVTDTPPEFIPNAGLSTAPALNLCRTGQNGCVSYVGAVKPSPTWEMWCFSRTGGTDPYQLAYRLKGGSSWTQAAFDYVTDNYSDTTRRLCTEIGGRHAVLYFTPTPITNYEFCATLVTGTSCGSAPVSPSAPVANPTRTMKCVILGTDGVTRSGPGISYTEQDEAFPNNPRCPDMPEGVIPQESWIETTGGGSTDRLWTQQTAPEVITAHQAYPLCRDASCVTELVRGDLRCHVTPSECLNWFEDPNKSSVYQCKYGPYTVALSECTIYAEGFRAPAGTTAPANPDSLADPVTGTPIESPFPAGRDAATFDLDVQDPATSRVCFPQGWAVLNPVEWVMKPVQCALEWAFVPRTAVLLGHVDSVRDQFEESAPGVVVGSLATMLPETVPNGCEGVPFSLAAFGDLAVAEGFEFGNTETVYIAAACPGDVLEPWAIAVRLLLTGGIVVLGIRALVSQFGAIVNAGGLGG